MQNPPRYRKPISSYIRNKYFLLVVVLLILAVFFAQQAVTYLLALGHPGSSASQLNPAQYVDPFIGTVTAPSNTHLGNGFSSGNVFPGAALPHGMVQWSPDTTIDPGGYRYDQSIIQGFSLTHFSGRGCRAYQDIPFMPAVGPLTTSPFRFSDYAAHFSHNNEQAEPGYYHVLLDPQGISVNLTTTLRTGSGQFIYPSTGNAMLLINAGGSATGNAAKGTGVQIVGNDEVTGSATSGHFCGGANTYTVYFAARFAEPFVSFGTWNGTSLTPGSRHSSGQHSGAFVQFDTTQNRVVQVKAGLSFVSVANARLNLERENPDWNFAALREKASTAWNDRLSQIQVTGGTPDEKKVFYTALYHTLFHPNVFSDVNGQYLGFDGKVHTANGYVQYENFPGWDMYRSLIALRALLEPREVGDMIQSLLADARQGGGGLPRWEVANDNSGGMVGDSIDAVVATSYALGVRGFDTSAALRAMDSGASRVGTHAGKYVTREGLPDYLKLGYVSSSIPGSASITLEYALDDFAIAQFAKALGNTQLSQVYAQRSQNWRNLLNGATGYIEPRAAGGSFTGSFSPTSGDGFVEGDSAQYTWMVPYAFSALFTALGGDAKVIARLDQHFASLNDGPNSPYAFMGNEPEFGAPWAYDFAGAPWQTQNVVRRIETQLFKATPDGLPGNDDGGAMSSWYVFAAMGLYPEVPGVAGFAVGSPLFSSITLHLGNGQIVQIRGQGAAADSPYVQGLKVNGQSYANPWLPFEVLKGGATLDFALGSHANEAWGGHITLGPV